VRELGVTMLERYGHLLDTRFNIPITKLDVGDLGYIDLSRYTHIILPDYSECSQYQSTGGILIKIKLMII